MLITYIDSTVTSVGKEEYSVILWICASESWGMFSDSFVTRVDLRQKEWTNIANTVCPFEVETYK
jgi:hypothetical protein